MPVMRKTPQKLFTKIVISEGYGFNTPQDGSVCKIKIIQDESNILTGFNEDKSKEIVVGDVDEPIDRIIEDCIRTMKEEEVCLIEMKHPDAHVDIIPVDSSDDGLDINTDIPVNNSENVNAVSDSGNPDCSLNSQTQICLNSESENVKELPQLENITPNKESDASVSNTEELNTDDYVNDSSSYLVKIQFQLLTYTTEPEIWEMSITEKWRRASYHKQRGLELYARGVYQYAFRRFGLTLKYVISLEYDVPSGEEEGMDIKGLKLSCYLNVAACQMRHHNFESVVINSTKALDLQPNNAKALYRRGAAYLQLQEYEKAKEDLTTAQQLEPKNQAIAKQLYVLKSHVQKLNQYYASAMKKMFS